MACEPTAALFNVAAQVRHPHRITLLRGNHESRQITQVVQLFSSYNVCNCGVANWILFIINIFALFLIVSRWCMFFFHSLLIFSIP